MPMLRTTKGMIWIRRRFVIGVFFNHRIKNNAAGKVQAVLLAESAST